MLVDMCCLVEGKVQQSPFGVVGYRDERSKEVFEFHSFVPVQGRTSAPFSSIAFVYAFLFDTEHNIFEELCARRK